MGGWLKRRAGLVAALSTLLAAWHLLPGSRAEPASQAPGASVAAESAQAVVSEQASTIPFGEVALSATSFNPSLGEAVKLSYRLLRPERVTVRVYDPDGGLVRTLVDTAAREAGAYEESWDGRDGTGRVTPNEAYTFVLETAASGVYDPTTISGGVVDNVTDAQFDWEGGTVAYKLPKSARVLVRLGIRGGPMLKTLVDWKPRIAGAITEYWDGRDENKLMSLREREGLSALITHVTLPDATIIAYGNDEETYREYKLGRGKRRPQKPRRPRQADDELRLRPEGLVPPAWSRAPQVSLTFPKYPDTDADAIPEVSQVIDVHVDVDESDRDTLLRDQFEILFFVDNVFFAEAERGYLPFNWPWELGELPPGDHILTVNVSSFRGQVGVASRKVRVVRE